MNFALVTAGVAMPSPADALIDKGEVGIALYGILFGFVALILFCGVLLRAISGRDKLIQEIVKEQGSAAKETAQAMQAMAVQLALLTASAPTKGDE